MAVTRMRLVSIKRGRGPLSSAEAAPIGQDSTVPLSLQTTGSAAAVHQGVNVAAIVVGSVVGAGVFAFFIWRSLRVRSELAAEIRREASEGREDTVRRRARKALVFWLAFAAVLLGLVFYGLASEHHGRFPEWDGFVLQVGFYCMFAYSIVRSVQRRVRARRVQGDLWQR